MDEQINKPVDTTTAAPENTTPLAQQPVTATQAPQSSIPLTSSVTARPAENLPEGVSDYSAEIAQLYDAQMAAQAQALETAYNQNLEAANYAKSQIAPQFTAQGNDLATQYERTRRNNNMQADMNGLNTGTGSQMALAQQSNYLDAFGKVRAAQAKAETEADRQIANLEISYKSAVAQALAQNDYQKAAALMQEYQRRDNAAEEMRRYNQAQAEQDAKIKAAYGDFSGYAELYGQDTANAMAQYWQFANPDYAYAQGQMSAADYYSATGRYPAGYSTGSSGGGYTSRNNGGDDADAAIEQLVIQGVPYAQAIEALNSDPTMSLSDYKRTKAAIDAAYQSTWAGGSNAGMYNAANNSAEQRGTTTWDRPKGVTPTANSKYSGG